MIRKDRTLHDHIAPLIITKTLMKPFGVENYSNIEDSHDNEKREKLSMAIVRRSVLN
jgi:hypothetical protein